MGGNSHNEFSLGRLITSWPRITQSGSRQFLVRSSRYFPFDGMLLLILFMGVYHLVDCGFRSFAAVVWEHLVESLYFPYTLLLVCFPVCVRRLIRHEPEEPLGAGDVVSVRTARAGDVGECARHGGRSLQGKHCCRVVPTQDYTATV